MVILNLHDKRPIYVQLVDGIKEQVIKGILKPGDQILSIRQLAGQLSITPNTVSRAYQELERQKVIISVKGKGNYINDVPNFKRSEEKMEELKKLLTQLCIEWNFAGYNRGELIEVIDEIYNNLKKEESTCQ
ncbi:MAG: hypothetical protein BEN19_03225 [Epulopiscium sp. Nuni2H_MBin003]|nr:MAG: hypothetical protein BEN19_03225 [Epulopiscium sp. Nuni2H_MBin003]